MNISQIYKLLIPSVNIRDFFVGYDTFYCNECGQFNQNLLYLGTEGV